MKRIFCILLAVLICIMCTACVQEPLSDGLSADGSEAEALFKVLLVCEATVKNETSQAALYAEQLKNAAEMVGMKEKQYTVCDGVSSADSTAVEQAIVPYLQNGYDMVIGFEEGYAPVMKQLAVAYPQVTFVQNGVADAALTNYYAYEIRMYESAYLCGLVAGFLSKNGKLGLVVSDIESVQAHQIANAFLLGAQVKKPKATLLIAEGEASENHSSAVGRLNRQECDGILLAVDDSEAVSQVKGSNMRVYTLYGKHSTETVSYQVSPFHQNQLGDTLQAVLSETVPYYNGVSVGMADGFFRYEMGYEEQAPVDAQNAVGALQTLFSKGEWHMFSGVSLVWDSSVGAFAQRPTAIKDNTGAVRILAGAGTPTAETVNGMNWWMQGITLAQ